MAIPSLPDDFKEFLKLLGSNGVEYLLIGGYAVNLHGYVRTTNDLDIWINVNPENAARTDRALREFGFAPAALTPDLFLTPNNVSAWDCRRSGLRFSPPFPESSSKRVTPKK